MTGTCECGKGDVVVLPGGKHCCSDTLRKFEQQHGRPYQVESAKSGTNTEALHACQNVGCREWAIGQMMTESGRKSWRCRTHWSRGKPPAA